MVESFDLSKLDERSFEHMINYLAMNAIGRGVTTFGPGADGGRDGFFEGEAPYPSETDRWNGKWYIQSKFHRPHLTKNAQEWLLTQIEDELKQFSRPDSRRKWPDNWIVATNIDISAADEVGTFDKATKLIERYGGIQTSRFNIWSGNKIVILLGDYKNVANQYLHLITPGHVLRSLYNSITDLNAGVDEITRYLLVTQFDEQQYTKLEQAGSSGDQRPGLQKLFIDLPYSCSLNESEGLSARAIVSSCARNHQIDRSAKLTPNWMSWSRHPKRARVWFIKAGPGQGKSTITQFVSQVQRAAFILGENGPGVLPHQEAIAQEIKATAEAKNLWPSSPRIPIYIELKLYATWYGGKNEADAKGILTYLSAILSIKVEQNVLPGTLKRLFKTGRWLFVFDGLDEVPTDTKDPVAVEVKSFIDDVLVGCNADAMSICTSRPQGYSGQFAELTASTVELRPLSPRQALQCATPLLMIDRTSDEYNRYIGILTQALESNAIQEIMKTPLQSHIMAIIVRDGGQPPERRWKLYDKFYNVVKTREANKASTNKGLGILLKDGDKLIKGLHNKLGFSLHHRAEQSRGASTDLSKNELSVLVHNIVSDHMDDQIIQTTKILMEATTDRLVLVNTPESGEKVRFDVRQLQEFFSAEYMYEGVDANLLRDRLSIIMGDQHWREVVHFVFSALVENNRKTDLTVAVNVLMDLDTHSEDENIRIYKRRISIGGILAAQLLAEKVLEQDKKDRQLFRRCFNAILGSTDLSALEPIVELKPSQSLSWMIDLLHEHLSEHASHENIGAAYISLLIVKDDHPKVQAISHIIRDAPDQYKAALLVMIGEKFTSPDENPFSIPTWSLEFIVCTLASNAWTYLNAQQLSNIVMALTRIEDFSSFISSRGFLPATMAGLFVKTSSDGFIHRDSTEYMETIENGPFNIHYVIYPEQTLLFSEAESYWDFINEAQGLFQFFSLIVRAQAEENSHVQRSLYRSLIDLHDFERLPNQWHGFLPERFLARNITRLDTGRIDWLLEHLSPSHRRSYRALTIPGQADFTGEAFVSSIINFPSIHLDYVYADEEEFAPNRDATSKLEEFENMCVLVSALERDPKILVGSVHQWGRLLQLQGELRSRCRSAIRASSLYPTCRCYTYYGVTPFVITLPEESSFLPHVARALADLVWSEHFSIKSAADGASSAVDWRGQLRSYARMYVPDRSALIAFASDDTSPETERVSAAIIYLYTAHRDDSNVILCVEQITKCYNSASPDWLMKASGTAMLDLIPSNPIALQSIGHILSVGKENYISRLEMSALFQVWRERSSAPVSNSFSAVF